VGKSDILKAIKNAENEAKKTLDDAESKASSILSDARVKATEILQKSQENINSNSRSMIEEAKINAQKDAAIVTKEGDEGIQEIVDKGKKQRKKAIDSVIESFMQ
tara:strand:+ start:116 stop:430 length:315 start_codon:yes stop_codon:yes gene_type:complete